MQSTERRRLARHDLALPVRFPLGEGRTKNLNAAGVYFATEVEVLPGTDLDFALHFGGGISQITPVLCQGRIVRIDRLSSGFGVAVSIDSIELHCPQIEHAEWSAVQRHPH